ncbi:hypothetical protein LCGC14_1366240 [marine sediment metagenome]|uniref:Uncharacterized protein n=1 Tax=marine sediment metagenome TaxID=412755 RepID=A0A0F9MLX1_9ZZZZ
MCIKDLKISMPKYISEEERNEIIDRLLETREGRFLLSQAMVGPDCHPIPDYVIDKIRQEKWIPFDNKFDLLDLDE